MANTSLEKKQRKITHSMGGNKTKINFVLIGKNNKVFKRRTSNSLEIATYASGNRHKQKFNEVAKNEQTVKRRVWKLKENNIRAKFQKKVKEFVDVSAPNI